MKNGKFYLQVKNEKTVQFLKKKISILDALLLGDTDGASTTTSGFGALATDTQAQRMTKTTMDTSLPQPIQVLTQFVVPVVGQELRVSAIFVILLTIQVILGDPLAKRVLHNVDDGVELGSGQLSSPLAHVNLGLAAHNPGITATNTGNSGQGVLNLLFSVNVCVQNTQNMLKVVLGCDTSRRLKCK